ncbi:heme peroxidase [Rhodocollybia butyracea]|uniref:Peroxidase n=1 Tax=Rhodocollybia butyracea TaxID=206335 RepID=A0A9P5P8S1_9AGAR|nr:heme peroxidase [Rhodocollybia butyracea]
MPSRYSVIQAVVVGYAVGVGYAHSTSTFQWPNAQLSYVDKQLWEGFLPGLVAQCAPRGNTTAYHDMSTHNVDDGSGGLDASIQFELDRAQNIGQGMIESLNDFSGFEIVAPMFGMADLIALGAIFAVAGCGGPLIPFRAGRVDATEAGPPNVPEPQQDLATHTEMFRQMGFNDTEMIALVACGHTIGGVTQVDFPTIVMDPEDSFVGFDTTTAFDNTIISQYLQNTTEDVLVVGPNVTTRSDFRIFSSDGNATMQSLLNPGTFTQTCADLIERMINTVPNGVSLTDPFSEPFDYVVSEPVFSYRNGTLAMVTTLRVLNPSVNATVTLLWADREGSFCPSTGCSVESFGTQPVTFRLTELGIYLGFTAERYEFNATINVATSISKFWFEINNNDGSDPITVDNGGGGFVIEQDSLFFDNGRTVAVSLTPSFEEFFRLVIAVRGDTTATVSMTAFDPRPTAFSPPSFPVITTVDLILDETNPPDNGFVFFTGNASITTNFISLTATSGGTTYTQTNFDMSATNFSLVEVSA